MAGDAFDLDEDIRTRVAWLYYMEGMTQDGVAKVVGMTRARVLRMLAACREDGTVQISVMSPLTRCVALGRQLEKRYGMDRAIVIPRPQVEADTAALIGAATGSYVSTILADGMTIGLGWGRTLSASLSSLPQHHYGKLTVVSLLGGLTRASVFNPSEFAWRFADRLGAECYMMAAPVYAPDARTREALVNHSGMEEVFSHAENLDLALISVGDLSPGSTVQQYDLLNKDEIESLTRAGAVGDLLCRFIDADGHLLDHPLNDCVISADPVRLRRARRIVLASGGSQKTAAIWSALRLLKPEVLITDEAVAERLIGDPRSPAPRSKRLIPLLEAFLPRQTKVDPF